MLIFHCHVSVPVCVTWGVCVASFEWSWDASLRNTIQSGATSMHGNCPTAHSRRSVPRFERFFRVWVSLYFRSEKFTGIPKNSGQRLINTELFPGEKSHVSILSSWFVVADRHAKKVPQRLIVTPVRCEREKLPFCNIVLVGNHGPFSIRECIRNSWGC